MGLEQLLGAAAKGAPEGIKAVTGVSSKINSTHISNRIARVYMATCSEFKGLAPTDVIDKVGELMHRSDIIKMYTKGGEVCDDDLVTTMEAIRWTGVYVTTCRKANFYLALVEPHKMVGTHPELEAKATSGVWNSMVLDDVEGPVYNGYDMLSSLVGYNLNILQKSLDRYEVII